MVVLHSDHGWHLGEYAMWEKRTNWELGTRVPLIIRVPWMEASVGKRTKAFAELVDIYQTVSELMGLPLPSDTVPFDGHSLVPVLADPANGSVKDYALSTFPRCAHVTRNYGARPLGPVSADCLSLSLSPPWGSPAHIMNNAEAGRASHNTSCLTVGARTSACPSTAREGIAMGMTILASKSSAPTSRGWDTQCAQIGGATRSGSGGTERI